MRNKHVLEIASGAADDNPRQSPRVVLVKVVAAVVAVGLLIGGYWLLAESSLLARISSGEALRDEILALGAWGPIAIVGLMTIAIVMSPIPSAPIALAAGYAYGHTWGTIYVLVGAELGALLAFALARMLGYEILHRWFGERVSMGLFGSQNTLMAVVFATRLLPFVSFDLVSYAAGLTPLSVWRFTLATLAGIVPASFLLAHFGGEVASADASRMIIAAVVLGGVVLVPLGIKIAPWVWRKLTGLGVRPGNRCD